ncbi:hypothetical protein CMO91_01170 [Candidatus Woesearchaeota archaeon]|jgi:hypothetical protein|nr:hypothetical protein [Candidatus Woesearchaeota archaeon]|tara:strand:- start:377 stop:679 length:303 start_codon:yes stop_codon:yes gene_type:complete
METVYEGPGPLKWLGSFLQEHYHYMDSEGLGPYQDGTIVWVYRITHKDPPHEKDEVPRSTTLVSEHTNGRQKVMVADGTLRVNQVQEKIQQEISDRLGLE